jgi:hypothetical protein
MTTTLSKPFKNSAQPSKTPQDSFFLFCLLMDALRNPEKFKTPEAIKNAVQDAQKTAGITTSELSPLIQQAVEGITGLATNPGNPDRALLFTQAVTKHTGFNFDNHGPSLLNPALASAMQKDEYLARKVNYAFDQARANGLDPNLFANQLWQESRFKDNAGSSVGARGIGQFMPATGAMYGLHSKEDFTNPWKSIAAAADHMGDLTKKFGDQRLALVAYNGGSGAITRTVGRDATIGEWMSHMTEERATKGIGASHLWRNQTYDYVTQIDSSLWTPGKQVAAAESMRTLQLANNPVLGHGLGIS